MNEQHSITEARHNLPKLIHEAEQGKTVKLTRRGKPVAVLLGIREFERVVKGRRSFVEAYEEFIKAVDLPGLAFDPVELLEGTRETKPGRDFQV